MVNQFSQPKRGRLVENWKAHVVVIIERLGSTCGSLPSLFPTANQEPCPRPPITRTSSTTLSGRRCYRMC